MNKFHFHAVDLEGHIREGVMEASDEDSARTILLDNEIHPKKLVPADSDAKVTWRPKPTRREDNPASHFYQAGQSGGEPTRSLFKATLLTGPHKGTRGNAGLTSDGSFSFHSRDNEDAAINLPAADLEVTMLTGFLPRIFRITRIDGRMHEFAVGNLMAPEGARETRRILNEKG